MSFMDLPAKAVVARELNDPASPARVELSATIATETKPISTTATAGFNRQVTLHALGDSNSQNGLNLSMYGNNAIVASSAQNPYVWAHVVSGGRIRLGLIGATGGYTSTQIKDTWLPQVIAQIKPGDYVAVMAGTNDSGLTGGIGGTQTKANLTAMYDGIKAAGGRVVACSILPATNDSNASIGNRARLNLWIEENARTAGHLFADVYGEVVNPANGWFTSGYNNDDLHLNGGGARKVGQMLATLLTAAESPQPYIAQYNIGTGANPADGLLKLGNALMLTDSNADGRADQLALTLGAANGSYSLVTEAGVKGKMQKVTSTGTASISAVTDYVVAGVVGHKYYGAFKFKIDVTDPVIAGGAKAFAYFYADGASALAGISGSGGGFDFSTPGVCTWASTFTFPAGGSGVIMFALGISGGIGSVQVGQLTLVDLTAQGIA